MRNDFAYSGNELDVFAAAGHWKSYWRSHIAQFVRGSVLEVGAGVGTNTRLLYGEGVRRWVCLEPDPKLAERLREAMVGLPAGARCEVVVGTLARLSQADRFDSILYLDVLEHIEDDNAELARAAEHLEPAGTLVVLTPAHPWLFSRFDEAIGHHRRYTKATLERVAPKGLELELLFYLDSVGLLASLANRLLLKSGTPTSGQITLWDRVLVPCSRWLDPLLGYSAGKSILGVWRRAP